MTANNASNIPDALRDRLEIVEIPGYVLEEKLEIAKRHLIPRTKKSIEALESFEIEDEILKFIIEKYTAEPGVRDLERQIKRIAERQLREQKEQGTAPKLKKETLTNYLGAPYPEKPDCASSECPGVVNGLTWSVVGGGRGYVQTVLSKGDGKIISTGKLGDMIKESVKLARTYIKSNAHGFGIDYQSELGLHDCQRFGHQPLSLDRSYARDCR